MTSMEEFDLELKDGTEVSVSLPAKLPAVLGMNTRDRIEVGFEGDQNRGQVSVENVQQVINDAQKYLVSNLLENHTDYKWEQITLDSHDRVWEYYASQVNGKKKVSSEEKSGDTSSEAKKPRGE